MDNKNVIIALVLSFAVLVAWQFLFVQPRMKAERQAAQKQEQQLQRAGETGAPDTPQPGETAPGGGTAVPQTPGPGEAAPTPGGPAPGSPAAGTQTREAALAANARVPIDTPRVSGSINLKAARLDDLRLKDYHLTVDPDSPTIVLLSPSGTPDATYAESGWVGDGEGPALPDATTMWRVEGEATLTPSTPVTLTWDNGAGLTFRRTFAVDDEYMFTVTQQVENTTDAPVTLYPYGLVARQGQPKTLGRFILHEGPIGVFGDEGLKEVDYGDVRDKGTITIPAASQGWLGFTDKYWATTAIPTPGAEFHPRFLYDDSRGTPLYQADYLGSAVSVPPGGGTGETTARIFAGAKVVSILRHYQESVPIEKFDLLIDWGWFYFITKPMFFVIDFFYRLFGNFGVAILLVTVLVKVAFFPLANKAYVSMSKMKKLQPQLTALRDRYKDDRMKQQQAMMEIYKKEKVNPLAGCIPIVIQIPVFFALYKTLFVTIEMRHAPFFGWIQDLSAPDPTTVFNLFGLLPFDPSTVPVVGHFLMLGVWPLIMGCTMWMQMKMNPTPPDPTQAMIFNWMPVFFTFLLASFPAGLVIYWAWNNTLSVLQQYVIMRRQGVKVELWDNLLGAFRKKKSSGTTT